MRRAAQKCNEPRAPSIVIVSERVAGAHRRTRAIESVNDVGFRPKSSRAYKQLQDVGCVMEEVPVSFDGKIFLCSTNTENDISA